MDLELRRKYNERFFQRMRKRRAGLHKQYEAVLRQPEAAPTIGLETPADAASPSREMILETIVFRERPVLFVEGGDFNTKKATILGEEAEDLVSWLTEARDKLRPVLPFVGRIDVTNFPGSNFVGSGWFVDTDIIATNRHVAKLIAEWDGGKFVFSRRILNRQISASLCNAHEYDDLHPTADRVFKIEEVLYIEPDSSPVDIAFARVKRKTDSMDKPFIEISSHNIEDDEKVCVIGYPARAPRSIIPDQNLMEQLYKGLYDVKRAAPGYGMGTNAGLSEHDCTTLGGNSGSVVLNAAGKAVGLHFAGLYQEANYAVPASVLSEYVSGKRWNNPIRLGGGPSVSFEGEKQVPTAGAITQVESGDGSVSVTIPLTITVGLGTPIAGDVSVATVDQPTVTDLASVEKAVKDFWDQRPEGVLGVRVGFLEENDEIGEIPCVAVSVPPKRLSDFETSAVTNFQGVAVRYQPADIEEQLAEMPALEAPDSIAYDDDARSGEEFSFEAVDEEMSITLHVGPEYSWDVLQKFLESAEGEVVSAIYEFHATHVKDALEAILEQGKSLKLVLDNASFHRVRRPDTEFDRVEVFENWANDFEFERVVAPEGRNGLISNSYHIKVTVGENDTFWLSSGNWKATSSQPIISQSQRENAQERDLPGNREWHVVINNKTLADRFRSHILQDFQRSVDLGGRELPHSMLEETFVYIPVEEAVVLERRPPSAVLEPKTINRRVKVRPLLTPDLEGEVYCEAVLDLIRSARHSLLFQIPYISMPSNPRSRRGYIDELIAALIEKLKTLDDARVLLRSGGSRYSSPKHIAWYFKSKGVNINKCLRNISNHHTKGMIVDGRRVLVGSHNWSKPGVTLNRDASLIFDDEDIALYYVEAFEIDWDRANRIRPRRFRRNETIVCESPEISPPSGYQKIPLSEFLTEE